MIRQFFSVRARTIVLATLLAIFGMALPAHAQAVGATTVDINFPDIVILHYFSTVDVTITNSALGTFLTGSPGDSDADAGAATPAAGGFTQELAIGPPVLTGDPSAALLTLQNAWAVRSISLFAATDTELAITNSTPTLNHTTTAASMTTTAVAVDDGVTNGATITFAAPGLVSPVVGNVELTIDMTNAINAGDYVGGVFTLTATNI